MVFFLFVLPEDEVKQLLEKAKILYYELTVNLEEQTLQMKKVFSLFI